MSFAQQSIGGLPYSFQHDGYTSDQLKDMRLAVPDLQSVRNEDVINDKQGLPLRISKLVEAPFSLDNSGRWYNLPGGDRLWKLKIYAKGAQAINFQYSNFNMPEGAKLYIYNEERSDVQGAYTSLNNKDAKLFATGNVIGDVVILEYFEPARSKNKGIIDISHIGYVYRHALHPAIETRADPCEVDVNCSPEGDNWQDEKRGVVRILLTSGGSQFWCSGSLVNNTALDCKPYILTALHCGVNSSANEFNLYIFYFNFERAGCGSGTAPTNQSITGSTKRADSGDGGGNSGSDYLLVEVNSSIPAAYNPYYNGWSAQNTASSSGVSIHHPAGDEKKISAYTSPLTSSQWGSVAGSHWRVIWSATTNGHGVTEGGSSGSPIFNNNGLVVGQLTGGSSFCTSPNSPDLYGKMSYNWTSNPGDDLKDWLDPTNSGSLTLAGADNPCGGNPPPPPPPAYCGSEGVDQTYEWIANVQVDNFSNPSAGTPYSDFTNQLIDLNSGGTANVTLTPAFSGQTYDEYWAIWIDFNKDLDFTDAGELVFSGNGSAAINSSFAVPASANGTTRMRVSMKWNSAPGSCETFDYGEVEDYTANFISTPPPPPVCGAPVSIGVSVYNTTTAKAFWQAVSNATKYQIRYRPVGSTSWTSKSSTSRAKLLKNLTPNTDYEYQLRTQCTSWGAWSSSFNFSTNLGSNCTEPTPVIAQVMSAIKVKIYWSAIANATKYGIRYRVVGNTSWTTKNATNPRKNPE